MRTAFSLLLIAHLAFAHGGGNHYNRGGGGGTCSTKTVTTCYTPTITESKPARTITSSVAGNCVSTIEKTTTLTTAVDYTTTLTATKKSVVTVQNPATSTHTRVAWVTAPCTTTKDGHHPKRTPGPVPDDMTNAERIRRALPIKRPANLARHGHRGGDDDHEEDHHHYHGGGGGANPSCKPTTVTITKTEKPTTVAHCSTSTVFETSCRYTSTHKNPVIVTATRCTKTQYSTVWVPSTTTAGCKETTITVKSTTTPACPCKETPKH